MDDFLPGDRVVCRLLYGEIVGNQSKSYDREIDLQIVASDIDGGYLVYIPQDLYVKDSLKITGANYRTFDLETRYLDSDVAHIFDSNIIRVYSKTEGACCARCGEHSHFAEKEKDSKFLCYLCKQNPYR